MTTKVHIQDEWQRNMVGIAVIHDQGGRRQVLQWSQSTARELDDRSHVYDEVEEDRLHLDYDDARALYEGLADFFGHSGNDTRALRRDYDAERKRVDLLIGNLIEPRRP